MLNGVPKIISPELLKILDEMGHGDRLVISDGNFPAESMGKNCHVIRADGHGVPELLDAILQMIPLDHMVESPVNLMAVSKDDNVLTPIWDEYRKIINKYNNNAADHIGQLERFDFYEKSKTCYCIIATGESALYANIMLQKGVVKDNG